MRTIGGGKGDDSTIVAGVRINGGRKRDRDKNRGEFSLFFFLKFFEGL